MNKDINHANSIKNTNSIKKFNRKNPAYFPHKPVGKTTAILNTIFGSLLTLGFGIPVFVLAITGGSSGMIFGLSVPLLIGLGMDLSAAVLFKRVMRYRRYLNLFKGRTFCFVDELATFSGFSQEFVLKDLQKMLFRGTFPHANIAEGNSLILLTQGSYDRYILEERKRKLLKEELSQENTGNQIVIEVNDTVEEGRDFIRQVNTANTNIEDYEVSDKVIRLSDIISQIINHIERHPEQSGNVRRFVQFYLPSTVKLLNTYTELEKLSIEGENILAAKIEIKDSLGGINKAFEKLFNNLFAGISMDISTDISVLQTMLAGEGLMKEEFDLN